MLLFAYVGYNLKKKSYQAFANIKLDGKKINKKIHNDIYRVASIYYQISMNVQHRLTTAL